MQRSNEELSFHSLFHVSDRVLRLVFAWKASHTSELVRIRTKYVITEALYVNPSARFIFTAPVQTLDSSPCIKNPTFATESCTTLSSSQHHPFAQHAKVYEISVRHLAATALAELHILAKPEAAPSQ